MSSKPLPITIHDENGVCILNVDLNTPHGLEAFLETAIYGLAAENNSTLEEAEKLFFQMVEDTKKSNRSP
jgi:hypothetical protein